MKAPQVLNTNIDTVIVVNGDSVINDTTQVKLTDATIQVDIAVLNQQTGTVNTVTNKTMTRVAAVDSYTIAVADIVSVLTDRNTHMAYVVENGGATNMRSFKIDDFSQDNDSFEAVWMRLPYQVEISTESWIKWYETDAWSTCLWKAKAYEGGTGTTYATLPERVTHRGPVIVGP